MQGQLFNSGVESCNVLPKRGVLGVVGVEGKDMAVI